MDKGFELDFQIKPEHLVDYLRVRQTTLNRVGGIIAVGLVAVGIYFVVSGDRALGAFEIVVGCLMLVTSQTRIFDSWRVKRAGRAVIGTRAHFKVDEAGIYVENAGASSTIEWSDVTDLKVGDAIIIPMRAGKPVGWIPTDAFASTEARDAALAYMTGQIAAARSEGAATPP